jgi:hypothetical protein
MHICLAFATGSRIDSGRSARLDLITPDMRLYREVLYVKSAAASIEAMKQLPWGGMALVEKP